MTLCRICDTREATTAMPFTRRPCCERCLARIVKIIAQYRMKEPLEYLGFRETMRRHPAGKAKKRTYEYDRMHGRHVDLRID